VADSHQGGREPLPERGRQGGDMPNRFPAPHAEHDVLLVAAHAAGDVDQAQRSAAEALLAGCPDCRELAADLGAIAAATSALPAVARTRDFTLRPEDAARLRPRGWRRLAAALGPTRLELLRPVAPVLMTLGVVGLLVSGLPLFQAGGSDFLNFGSGAAAPAAASTAPERAAAAAPSAGPSGRTSDNNGSTVKGSPAPATALTPTSGLFGGAQASPSGMSDLAGEAGGAGAAQTTPPDVATATPAPVAAPGPNFGLAAISAALLLLGLGLFGLRRALRRTA
jgi:hypothetical protein